MNDKPRNSGQWTEARFRSFIVSALRSATMRWSPKWECIDDSFVKNGKNPKTGRKCKLHKCLHCNGLFPKGEMRADHIEPVIDPQRGFVSWDEFIDRMFVEKHGFQSVCDTCHKEKTSEERKAREQSKKLKSGNLAVRKRIRKPL